MRNATAGLRAVPARLMESPTDHPQFDGMPAYTQMADRGCNIHPSCLKCPLPKCKYDLPVSTKTAEHRNAAMFADWKEGLSVDEVAAKYRVSRKWTIGILTRLRGRSLAVAQGDNRVRNPISRMEVPVRRRVPKKRTRWPTTKPRAADWHNRILILRAWGYGLKVISKVTDLDHTTIIHHLRGNCRCLGRAA